jgi:putative ABC transport system substrate-binding protein
VRWSEGSDERLDRYAAELIQSGPNVIVAQTRAVFPLRRAGATIPVVFAFSGDPVMAKLVETLARPGGAFTGLSMLSLDLTAKRMELLKELMPGLKRVAIIANPGHAGEQAERQVSITSAQALKLTLEYFPVRNSNELTGALEAIEKARCEAIIVFPDAGTMTYSERIAAFTLKTRIPAMSGWVVFAENGNLATYGPELRDAFRRVATYVDKILKGARPADLPVELPTRFELAINMKVANALGLPIPKPVLFRADRIIE